MIGVIPDILRERAATHPDRPFVLFGERTITFREMDERSGRVAGMLRAAGVGRGDRVCLSLSNRAEFLESWFALAKLGAVMVPLGPGAAEEFLRRAAIDPGAAALVTDGSSGTADEAAFARFGTKIWCGAPAGAPDGFLGYHEAVAASSAPGGRFPAPGPSDPMSIICTPGTTGFPKAVMLSHGHYCSVGRSWSEIVIGAGPGDVFFTTRPLSRIRTQTLSVMSALVSGCPLVLRERFDAATFFEEIRRRNATVFDCSADMIAKLMELPPRENDARNPARLAFGGAGVGSTGRAFEARYGLRILQEYNITECGGAGLVTSGATGNAGSIGKPLPCYEVKVVDEFDEELPRGISGEIVLRPRVPDAIFLGYCEEPDRTAESMRNGWFHSGDRGYADDEGNFFFIDRMKDCIRRRGATVSSTKIEGIVNSHPGVLESAVVGVPAELDEEDIKVFIVPKPGASPSLDEITAWCAGRLSADMVPRHIEVVRELPKTAAGETRKFELRRRTAGDQRDRKKVNA